MSRRFSVSPARAVDDEAISDPQYRTLAALGTLGDKNGWCTASLAELAAILHKSRQVVARDLVALKRAGYINSFQHKKNGGRLPTEYQIKFDLPCDHSDHTLSPSDDHTLSTSDNGQKSAYNELIKDKHVKPKFQNAEWDLLHGKSTTPEALEVEGRRQAREAMRVRFEQAFRPFKPAWDHPTRGWKDFDLWLVDKDAQGQPVEQFAKWWRGDEFRLSHPNMLTRVAIDEQWGFAFTPQIDAPVIPAFIRRDESDAISFSEWRKQHGDE